MKNLIYKIRKNNIFYFISIVCSFIFLIGGMALTNVNFEWGQRVIIVGIFMITYLMVFLGVNPIIKGIVLTLIPLVSTITFTALLEKYVPNHFYQEWLIDSNPRTSLGGIIFLIIIAIVLKLSRVKPYIKKLEKNKEDEKHG
jgi:hypothetical protein